MTLPTVPPQDPTPARATFAAGCFWGVETAFRAARGVISTRVGYTGGTKKDPTYEDVCKGNTGHAEAVEVIFDPGLVSYRELLSMFFAMHDPTTLNRQGPDVGNQYRSAIFYHDEAQKNEAIAMIDQRNRTRRFSRPIVTEVVPATVFYQAEEYHQQYFSKHPGRGCHI